MLRPSALPVPLLLLLLLLLYAAWTLASMRRSTWLRGECGNVLVPANASTNQSLARSELDCAVQCMESAACNAINYWPSSARCLMTSFYVTGGCGNYTVGSGVRYKEKRCLNGGVEDSENCTCCCGFLGNRCERAMEDCLEGVPHGYTVSGYWMQPRLAPAPFFMRCGSLGGNHILIRSSGIENFTRGWSDYSNGFGRRDFFVGLSNLHYMTYSKSYNLRFSIRFKNGSTYMSGYNNFLVDSEGEGFRFRFQSIQLFGSFVNADPCLLDLNNTRFSTVDVDNDNNQSRSCAEEFGSGWWHSPSCAQCNPTGLLLRPDDMLPTQVPREVFWNHEGSPLIPQSLTVYLI